MGSRRGAAEVALLDLTVGLGELALHVLEQAGQRRRETGVAAMVELELGAQAREPEQGGRRAVARIGVAKAVVKQLDGRRDRMRVGLGSKSRNVATGRASAGPATERRNASSPPIACSSAGAAPLRATPVPSS